MVLAGRWKEKVQQYINFYDSAKYPHKPRGAYMVMWKIPTKRTRREKVIKNELFVQIT